MLRCVSSSAHLDKVPKCSSVRSVACVRVFNVPNGLFEDYSTHSGLFNYFIDRVEFVEQFIV